MNFTKYLTLGNTYEQQGRIYIAAALYTIALNNSTSASDRQAISEYLSVLRARFRDDDNRCSEVKNCLLGIIAAGEYEMGLAMMDAFLKGEKIAESHFIDNDISIIYIFFQIYNNEMTYMNHSTIWDGHTDMTSIRRHYYNLKYMIRRVEVGLDNDKVDEIVPYIIEENVSVYAIAVIENNINIDKLGFVRNFCRMLHEKNMDEYGQYFKNRYGVDNVDKDADNSGCVNNLPSPPKSHKTVEFIICVNDSYQYEECRLYIESMQHDAIDVIITPIYDARYITEAYNRAMKASQADYKVYMHQDAFLIDKYFMYEFIELFEQNSDIGMIGVAGSKVMPDDGVWWHSDMEDQYMDLYQDIIIGASLTRETMIDGEYVDVAAIDGVLMITAVDVEWREDVFTGWHFYDMSHSFDVRAEGYRVVIPRQESIWCLHEQRYNKRVDEEYNRFRKIFIEEYLNKKIQN